MQLAQWWVITLSTNGPTEMECIQLFQRIGIKKTVPIEKRTDKYMLNMFQTSSQWEGDKEPCSSPTLFIDCMHAKLVRNKPVHVRCRYTRIIQST